MVGCGGLASVLKGSNVDCLNSRLNDVMLSSRGEDLIPHCMVGIKLGPSWVLSAILATLCRVD